jgi:transcriptional regulator with XRE-family HTH domain
VYTAPTTVGTATGVPPLQLYAKIQLTQKLILPIMEDSVPAGQMLKSLRNRRKITVREVEQASRRIADVKGDKQFYISNGWLARLENGNSGPNMCKLFSLSVIYHTNLLDLLRLYNIDVDEKEKYEPVADPYRTQLIPHNGNVSSEIPFAQDRSSTGLNITGSDDCASHIIYGHMGLNDFTMYPMIRPGALLKIDMSQNKLVTRTRSNEYERPIYFIELRNAFACGWCELQCNELLIIPHHSSFASVRRFHYPRDAEIVGRVVGYSTNCVDVCEKI